MRLSVYLILFIISFSSCASTVDSNKTMDATSTPLTVILVRHAEKQTNQSNPRLKKEGEERAELLADMLEKIELDAVFSTQYKRTEATARPTAEAHQLDIQSYDPSDLSGFADMLKSDYSGQTVLVVGHSNTTPSLTGILEGQTSYNSFDESDYGNLVVVTIPEHGSAKTIFLRY